ncbi:ATP-binding protein [Rhodoferax sp. BLA1]|uniref:ATP-binding protein n=1 Tax=Rhodoferax sp. BLA1 TaxID=2576062 RepID=UPI0015D2BA9F|nr:ATP-binding protein [Rhodoferax sp. BLA1]
MTTSPETPASSLPEYEGNPFIARLPPLRSQLQLLDALAARPEYHAQERGYAASLRKHCIMRLGRYFEPLERQIQLADRFGMLLRQGYIGRNPLTHDYIRHLQNGAERIEAKSLTIPTRQPVENTATSFALAGCSGIGKSKAIEKVLHQYPQCIQHTDPFSLVQITWLKLDCPHQGSPKQLCINFFSAVDRLVGTNYFNWYGSRRASVDEMMVHMAHVANLHALGVLVIDEIQHLNKTKIGPDALLNFLVTLVNTIGVPVILIGTLSAIPLLQENFRQARRASGLGSLIWDRMPKGKAWDYFISQLWQYQWTRVPTEISSEIRDVLYDESQGILDIVVKLFMLAQLRVVSIGEVRHGPEVLTAELLRKVAREDFRVVRPMLDALRANDTKALLKYDDLLPLQAHVNQVLASAVATPANMERMPAAAEHVDAPMQDDGTDSIRKALSSLGIADDVAHVLVSEARALNPSADPLLLMATISERLAQRPVKVRKRQSPKLSKVVAPLAQDLRHVVAIGKKAGQSGYQSLLAAGLVKPPLLDLAA